MRDDCSSRWENGFFERHEVKVKHTPSRSYFGYTTSWDNYSQGSYQVGSDPRKGFTRSGWDDLIDQILQWAKDVVYWTETPDLWEEFRRARQALETAQFADSSNTIFTSEEQRQISTRISEIKDYIRTTYELTSEQMSRVEERLDAAEEASHRIGRKDWLMALNGALFSLVLSDLIPQQAATHILVMAITGLGHLFGIGGVPPSLPPG